MPEAVSFGPFQKTLFRISRAHHPKVKPGNKINDEGEREMRKVQIVPGVMVVVAFLIGLSVSRAQSSAEQELRRAIESRQTQYTDDLIFWSGAYDHPIIGKTNVESQGAGIAKTRKNEKRGPEKIEKLVVSTSGDLAYEYGATTLEFDDAQTGTHASFTPTHLRVWKRENGAWKLAAAFVRPNPSKICSE